MNDSGFASQRRHVVTLQVVGRPAAFATAGEAAWKAAVREAVAASGCNPAQIRFAVEIELRLGPARNANEVWDIDNLVKPTLDAMEGVFGAREWKGRPQPADDRVDELHAVKRQTGAGEEPGARIEVWEIDPR